MLAPSFDAIELFWRAYFIAVGVAIFMHMHCTANFTTHGPRFLRYVLLPLASGMGMGMVWSGARGDIDWGLRFSALAAGVLVVTQIAAWLAGVRVSAILARLYRKRGES